MIGAPEFLGKGSATAVAVPLSTSGHVNSSSADLSPAAGAESFAAKLMGSLSPGKAYLPTDLPSLPALFRSGPANDLESATSPIQDPDLGAADQRLSLNKMNQVAESPASKSFLTFMPNPEASTSGLRTAPAGSRAQQRVWSTAPKISPELNRGPEGDMSSTTLNVLRISTEGSFREGPDGMSLELEIEPIQQPNIRERSFTGVEKPVSNPSPKTSALQGNGAARTSGETKAGNALNLVSARSAIAFSGWHEKAAPAAAAKVENSLDVQRDIQPSSSKEVLSLPGQASTTSPATDLVPSTAVPAPGSTRVSSQIPLSPPVFPKGVSETVTAPESRLRAGRAVTEQGLSSTMIATTTTYAELTQTEVLTMTVAPVQTADTNKTSFTKNDAITVKAVAGPATSVKSGQHLPTATPLEVPISKHEMGPSSAAAESMFALTTSESRSPQVAVHLSEASNAAPVLISPVAPVSHEGVSASTASLKMDGLDQQLAHVRESTLQLNGFARETHSAYPETRVLPDGPITVSATPNSLEVGLTNGTEGWLRIRAELKPDSGQVTASLVTVNSVAAESLHKELPAMTAYLAGEQVNITTIGIEKALGGETFPSSTADGYSAGGQAQGEDGQQRSGAADGSGLKGIWRETEEKVSGAEILARPNGANGNWLNVQA